MASLKPRRWCIPIIAILNNERAETPSFLFIFAQEIRVETWGRLDAYAILKKP